MLGGCRGKVPGPGPPLCEEQVASHGLLDAQDLPIHCNDPGLHCGLQLAGHFRARGILNILINIDIIMRRKAFHADCGCRGSPGSYTHVAAFQRGLCQDVQAYGRIFGKVTET